MMPSSSVVCITALWLCALSRTACAQAASPTSDGFFGPCPAAVSLQNGGFEDGHLTPWSTVSYSSEPTSAAALAAPKIVSSGDHSAHALEVQFPPANSIGWYVGQKMGQQCEGVEYEVSFAMNWIGFALHGEPNDRDNFCTIGVQPSYCNDADSSPGYYNASTKAGWITYRYTCKSRKTAYANLNVNVQCLANYNLPSFTLQLDNMSVGLASGSSATQTSGGSAASSTTSAVATSTGSSNATSGSGAAPSDSPPIHIGNAGRVCPSASLCLFLGWMVYQVSSL